MTTQRMMSTINYDTVDKRTEEMNSVAEYLTDRFWFTPDQKTLGLAVQGENQIQWYRDFYSKHGKEQGEQLRDLYTAAENLYNILHVYHGARLIADAMSSTKNKVLRASGIFGFDVGELGSEIEEEIRGTFNAFQKLVQPLPRGELREKVTRDLNVAFVPLKIYTSIPGFAFTFGTMAGSKFTSVEPQT